MNKILFKRLKIAVAILTIVGMTGPFSFRGTSFVPIANAGPDAVIKGKIVDANNAPISFTCDAPPAGQLPPPGGQPPPPGGQPPPSGSPCGIGVNADAGPGSPQFFGGANPSDGSFNISVEAGAGKKFRIIFAGPPDKISKYKFPELFVDVRSGDTKDLGTIKASEKQGHIKGRVIKDGTTTGVPNVVVSAFPMFGAPQGVQGQSEGPGEPPQGPGNFVMPSSATTTADGSFDILVNAGRYGVNIDQRPDSTVVSKGGPPVEAFVETDTSTVSGLEIKVIEADATIEGFIVDENGTKTHIAGGVGARPIPATEGNFEEYNSPIQPPDGKFTIKVPSARATQYQLMMHAPPGTKFQQKSGVTVTVIANGKITQNITVAKFNSSIYGSLIGSSGFSLNGCVAQGDKFGGKDFGQVCAFNPDIGYGQCVPVDSSCKYTIDVGPGEYNIDSHFNPTAGFINRNGPPKKITVEPNTNVQYDIIAEAGDVTVTGQVLDPNGNPVANVPVNASNMGQFQEEMRSGEQEGPKGRPPDEFRGPGGTNDPRKMMEYCKQPKNEKECTDFKLPPGATGPGGCTNMKACTDYCTKNPKICEDEGKSGGAPPGGSGPQSIGQSKNFVLAAGRSFVRAGEPSKSDPGKGPDFRNVLNIGTQTRPDGTFELRLLSGNQFEIRSFPPINSSYLPSKPVQADFRTDKTAKKIVLQLRESFTTLSGNLTKADGSKVDRGFVGCWGEDGSNGGSPIGANGTFSLGIGQGKQHCRADSFDGKTPYRSKEAVLLVTEKKPITQNFKLEAQDYEVFEAESKTFDASQQSDITLSDGTKISIPAGALATTGNVTFTATPTTDLKPDEDRNPVTTGFSFSASKSDGTPVTTFNSQLSVTLKYDGEYVDDLGVDENFLSTSFVDGTSGAWSAVENASQDATNDSFTLLLDHFTDFAVVAPATSDAKSVSIETKGKNTLVSIDNGAATFTLSGKATLWNAGTANFDGTQYVVVSNKTKGKTLSFYKTDAKLFKKLTAPIKCTGLQQLVEDVTNDGVADVTVACTNGPANAVVYNVKGKFAKQVIATGTKGQTGKTALSTVQGLFSSGVSNLTTLFGTSETRAWKVTKGKLVQAAKASVAASLAVKNGKVEKVLLTPTVSKKSPAKCSSTSTTNFTLTGKNFGSSPILIWNGETPLKATASNSGKTLKFTVNPNAAACKSVNTATAVNDDGGAGTFVIMGG